MTSNDYNLWNNKNITDYTAATKTNTQHTITLWHQMITISEAKIIANCHIVTTNDYHVMTKMITYWLFSTHSIAILGPQGVFVSFLIHTTTQFQEKIRHVLAEVRHCTTIIFQSSSYLGTPCPSTTWPWLVSSKGFGNFFHIEMVTGEFWWLEVVECVGHFVFVFVLVGEMCLYWNLFGLVYRFLPCWWGYIVSRETVYFLHHSYWSVYDCKIE